MINLKKCKFTKAQRKEIKIGAKFELEHTRSYSKAKKISAQHVCEFPTYYTNGLIQMEKRLKKMQKGGK